MKLEKLDFPYSNDYVAGYIVINNEHRKTLVLKHKDGTLHSTQYARYLIACKLGRYLTKDETVDHINNDKTDDSIDNLTVMSLAENIRKSGKEGEHGHSSKIRKGCKCPLCIAKKKEWQRKYLEKHGAEVAERRKMKRQKKKNDT